MQRIRLERPDGCGFDDELLAVWPEIARAMTVAPRQHKREEIMKKVQEMLMFMNQEDRRVGTCTVCRLYGQVREFRPARQAAVIVMQ